MFQRIVIVAGLAFVAVAAVSGQAVPRARAGQAGTSTAVAPPAAATVAAQRAVVDKYCRVPPGMRIGLDHDADRLRFHVTDSGVTLVTPQMLGQGNGWGR